MLTRCKVVCNWKQPTPTQDGVYLTFTPVTQGSEENEKFFKYTPGGQFQFYATNLNIAANFELGEEYYLDFSSVK